MGTVGTFKRNYINFVTMKTDEHLYTITRSEFAKSIGKSREAVKKDMMRGKYKDLYIFKNNQYYFKTREAVRENQGLSPVKSYPAKRKINRGNHDNPGSYSSSTMKRVPPQFKVRNQMVKLMSAQGKIKPEDRKYLPKLESKMNEWLREEKTKSRSNFYKPTLSTPRGNFNDPLRSPGDSFRRLYSSGGVYHCGSNKGYGSPEYLGGPSGNMDNRSFKATNRGPNMTPEEWAKKYYG